MTGRTRRVTRRKRETCTECSLRRQKCDRQVPCGRCVKRGVAEKCSVLWDKRGGEATHRSHAHLSVSEGEDQSITGSPQFGASSASWRSHPRLQYVFTSPTSPQQRMSPGWGGAVLTSPSPDAVSYEEYLETLLPSRHQIQCLIDYHELYLLWYHGSYHGPTFQCVLRTATIDEADNARLDIARLDLQWIALLLSIMVGSLVCAPSAQVEEWGFHCVEVSELALVWYKACVNCLNRANYSAKQSIYSVQAIATLALSAHILDQSAELSVLRGAATQIARRLGLDQLEHNSRLDTATPTSSDADRHVLLQRETGRRLWFQLCVQDWLLLPFAESHMIDPLQFTSCKPANRNFLTMDLIDEGCPTYVSYTNYLFQIAKLMAKHHEAVLRSSTLLTKYEHTIDYDHRLRALASKAMPTYFDVGNPVDPAWPDWTIWARRSLTVCFAHKMIMIHRRFLRKSFEVAAFSATRSTCLAAARTILKEAQTRDMDGPTIWVDEAYCASAGAVLCLDMLHRSPTDSLFQKHADLVRQCINRLHRYSWGSIAARGARVLEFILDNIKAGKSLTIGTELSEALQSAGFGQMQHDGGTNEAGSVDVFPPPAGMSNKFLFEELFQTRDQN
ncbi:hypothetical protein LLEC1_02932 [Akanthomyces lecanii]|uniref:Zn(2)-C6 fungal-type domain-containing protein n=1 Tax=Cordyceps confragosa TaxID=2714763 RepID=A0A179IA93_CORDF|nr:hypothetical protein LLEC1_02932 [Akanthomyces lecanii]